MLPPAFSAVAGGGRHRAPRRPAGNAGREQRRAAARRRRNRLAVVGTVLLSALVLVAWFPAAALLHQRQALAATSVQLAQLRQQDRALASEQHKLASPAEIGRVARQGYQLVSPGQQAVEVLPPNGRSATTYGGDPGLQAPVAPSAASELPPGSVPAGAPTTSGAGRAAAGTAPATAAGPTATGSRGAAVAGVRRGSTAPSAGGSPGLWSRIAQTLEFWH